jgi:hypothetical protein
LKADKLRVIGGLHAVWCLFDAHSEDGELQGYTLESVDDEIRFPGFSAAIQDVGWLQVTENSLALPRFDSHNGQSAKRRAQEADRKREVRKTSAVDADEKRTREEKRREEKEVKKGSTPAKPKKPKTETTLTEYLAARKADSLPPFDDDNTATRYADEVGLPAEFLELAYFAFYRAHTGDGRSAKTCKLDWCAHFRNSVKEGWYKLWGIDQAGTYYLTTAGKQASLEIQAMDRAA